MGNIEKKSNKKIDEVLLSIILGLVLFGLVMIHIDVNINHYCTQMDADIASEALLATRVAENCFITPDTWVGSSGVRIISVPNLAAFFYHILGNNMNLAMGISCSIMMLMLILAMVIYFRQLSFSWFEVFTSLIMFLSVSDILKENQSMLLLWASYYVPTFISLYVILIFYNISIKRNKTPLYIWIISATLAILNGMQGVYGCLYCFFPVLGAELLRMVYFKSRKKDSARSVILVWLFSISVLSFGVSKLVNAYGLGMSRNIRHAPEKFISQVWPAMKDVVYLGNAPYVIGVLCVLAVVGYLYVIRDILLVKISDKDAQRNDIVQESKAEAARMERNAWCQWGHLSLPISMVICILSLTFTTMEVAPRYFIVELFMVGTGIGLFLNKSKSSATKLVAVIVAVVGIIACRYYYDELIVGDYSKSSDEYMAAQWMQERGYEYGYAIFDNANTTTVMSNNAVKVRSVNNMKEMEGCKWLTDKSWYPPFKSAEGATCYLVSPGAVEDFSAFLTERSPEIVETAEVGKYTVYVLDHDYTVWKD